MFFSKGVDEDIQRRISGFFGFQVVQNLSLYLGISLFHEKVTNNTLRFVIDKVRSKLCSWDARQLSLAGRITLAQAVLLSISSYFMQSMMIPKGLCEEIEVMVRKFIWGSTNGNKKLLWFLRDHNTSFMMKLRFKLLTDYSSLWVNVLWSKYGRSLLKIWPLIRENLLWSVRDGRNINCWKDSWVPNVGPLYKKIDCNSSLDMDCSLSDMVTKNGDWNLDFFCLWLSEDIIHQIVGVSPPQPNSDPWNMKEDVWKLPWKYQGPQRVRVFIWLAIKHRLLTNVEIIRRGLGSDTVCGSLYKWMELNLRNQQAVNLMGGVNWACFFGIIIWRMWKNQNLRTFQGLSCSINEVVKASLYWAKQYDFVLVSSNGWVYLNTDGSVNYVDMFAAGGGLLRDHNRTWIVGFTRYLGNCEVIDSELWGILDGLQITLDRSFRKVIIRTNNLEAVNLIHKGVCEGSNSALITRILLFFKLLSH
ncbi:hypothetical protein V6Z11_D02G102300 [Gossypium hirsutum]